MRRLSLALVLAIAALSNFLYLANSDDYFYPDSFTYLAPAKAMIAMHRFANATGLPETLRTPIYPYLLCIFDLRVEPVIVLQHILNVLLAGAVYWLIARRGGSRLVALAAGLLFALDPPTIHYANKLLTETTFTALLFIVFVLALDLRWPVVNGVLIGILVLARPVAIVYFAVIAAYFAWRRMRVKTIVAFVIAALVLPLAWATRNRIESGVFTISSIGGANMLLYRAAGALAVTTDYEFKDALKDNQDELRDNADDEIQKALHVRDAEDLPDAVRNAWYGKIGRRIILQHPFAFALLTFRGLMVNCFDSDWDSIMIVSRLDSSTIQLFLDAATVAEIVLALIGLLWLWRRDRPLAWLLFATLAYFLFISAGGEAEARFRVPVVPQLAIAAAFGIEAVRRVASPEPR